MKKLLPILIIAILFASCKSSSKQLEKGDYDAAIKKSAKKIKKSPGKFEEVDTFNDAYRMAYNRDNTEVTRLKQTGDPANWAKIYKLFLKMEEHQNLAASLPPVGINYKERDFSGEIANAKIKATEYAYARGLQLLKTNNRFDARKAYKRFKEAKKYDSKYKKVNKKIAESKRLGMTNVFFTIEDNAEVVAPQAMMDEIQRINIDELDRGWLNYDTYVDSTKNYHYSIILNMKLITVSPESLKEKGSVQRKEIEDGFDYALDANGNVKKDSLGNDIQITRYKTITCRVKRFHQQKTARISGTIDYYDNGTDKLMKSEPITSDAIFEHFYTLAFGNLNALNHQTRKELDIRPLPFPKSDVLVVQAGNVLKAMTKETIVKNKSYLK